MELITFILAMIIAFVSAIVGGMVGGAYLILIPALLFLGMDVHYVIGLTKIITIALGLVFINYMKNGKVNLKSVWPYALFVIIGSAIGSLIVIEVNKDLLQIIIAIFMVIITLFILFNKDFGVKPSKINLKKKHTVLAGILFFVLGIYSGFYSAASTIFGVVLFTLLLKKDFVESIGSWLFLAFVGGIAGAIIFTSKGLIDYAVALPMGIICFLGGWVGSRITLKRGTVWVRYVLIIITIAFAIKLLFF